MQIPLQWEHKCTRVLLEIMFYSVCPYSFIYAFFYLIAKKQYIKWCYIK